MAESGTTNEQLNLLKRAVSPLAAAICLLAVLAVNACSEASTGRMASDSTSVYEYRHGDDSEGTGKFYMGREIAPVMGHMGAGWLERPSREVQELPNRVVQALEVDSADVVADIGAGTGYFTFRISPYVPEGRVLAVDIQPEMLDIVRTRMSDMEIENVQPVLGTPQDPRLPRDSVDVALIVDSYHEFSHPYEMMTNIVKGLKPGGRVVLVEYRGEDPTVPIDPLHKMTEEQVRIEMESVGLSWIDTKSILPQQHIMIFEKPQP